MTFLRMMIGPLTSLLTVAAYAGGWSSGGGTVFKDQNNPWFLATTSTITYCIARDASNVSASEDDIDAMVRRALAFWKEQFRYAQYDDHESILRLGDQEFTRRACPPRLEDALDAMDIVFQFGVFTEKQREYLRDPRDFIAATVRTDYDERRLRGKGFVYFSADSGPWRYRGDALMDRAWSAGDGGPLLHVLMHELGHIFGLPHTGSQFEVMGEGYPGFVLVELGGSTMPPEPLFNVFKPDEQFFRGMPGDRMFCAPADWQDVLRPLLRLFFLDEKTPCLRVRHKPDRLEVHYKTSAEGPEMFAGEALFETSEAYRHEDEAYVGGIGITKEQQVFSDLSAFTKTLGFVAGPKIVTPSRTGVYVDRRTGRRQTVQARISAKGLLIGGYDGDKIFFDAFRRFLGEESRRRAKDLDIRAHRL